MFKTKIVINNGLNKYILNVGIIRLELIISSVSGRCINQFCYIPICFNSCSTVGSFLCLCNLLPSQYEQLPWFLQLLSILFDFVYAFLNVLLIVITFSRGKEIRTLGTFTSAVLAGLCNKPLCHPSSWDPILLPLYFRSQSCLPQVILFATISCSRVYTIL